jgi:N-acyl homoserine lactone hydrolase
MARLTGGLPTITVLDCGWLRAQERTFVEGGSHDELAVPVPAWLIRHREGDAVFDLGLHAGLAESDDGMGPLAKLFSAELDPDGTVSHRLAAHDVDPMGPITAIVSHGHFDHVGGLCELPNARVVVNADEWAVALADDDDSYDRSLVDLGHDVLVVRGEHDVFGDGTVVCFPTPGHTCGHQSLRVQTDDGPVVLAADACYFGTTLDDGRLPRHGFDLDEQRRSLQLLRRARAGGATVVPGHDPAVVQRLLDVAAERPG